MPVFLPTAVHSTVKPIAFTIEGQQCIYFGDVLLVEMNQTKRFAKAIVESNLSNLPDRTFKVRICRLWWVFFCSHSTNFLISKTKRAHMERTD